MQSRRSISASMVRPHKAHSPKITSSPAAADTLSALLEDLGAEPRDFDCIVTGDLGHIGADLLLTLLLLIQLLLILLSNLKLLANEKMRETTAGLRSSGFFVL